MIGSAEQHDRGGEQASRPSRISTLYDDLHVATPLREIFPFPFPFPFPCYQQRTGHDLETRDAAPFCTSPQPSPSGDDPSDDSPEEVLGCEDETRRFGNCHREELYTGLRTGWNNAVVVPSGLPGREVLIA